MSISQFCTESSKDTRVLVLFAAAVGSGKPTNDLLYVITCWQLVGLTNHALPSNSLPWLRSGDLLIDIVSSAGKNRIFTPSLRETSSKYYYDVLTGSRLLGWLPEPR